MIKDQKIKLLANITTTIRMPSTITLQTSKKNKKAWIWIKLMKTVANWQESTHPIRQTNWNLMFPLPYKNQKWHFKISENLWIIIITLWSKDLLPLIRKKIYQLIKLIIQTICLRTFFSKFQNKKRIFLLLKNLKENKN
jgi:hypothetical protein